MWDINACEKISRINDFRFKEKNENIGKIIDIYNKVLKNPNFIMIGI